MNNKNIEILHQLLTKLEAYIPHKDFENHTVSKGSVGWHVDHSLKVFNTVSEWTIASNPKDYKRNFSFWRLVLFPLNYIPRGRVKAPKVVQPPARITVNDLQKQLNIGQKHISQLSALPKTSYFKHFVFGKLSKRETLKFLHMHTLHHIKIIEDILNK